VNAARAEAARRAEVRSAARSWRTAGAIDDATLTRIETAYPNDRPRLAPAWRVVVFVIVTVAANALFFGIETLIHGESAAGPWLLFAAVLAGTTEFLLSGTGVGENGSAAATSFWAVTYAVVGCALAAARDDAYERSITVALLSGFILFALACWRWGFAVYGIFAAIGLFLFDARFAHGRLSWLLLGSALILVSRRLPSRLSLAPPYRSAAGGILVVAAAAVYAAVNRYSLDRHLVESLQAVSPSPQEADPAVASLSWLATAAFPALLVLWGLRSRRTLVLDTGLVLAGLSLVTLRYYVHLAPLWVVLAAAGAALVLAALGIHRWLRRAADGERHGFTARPLYGRGGRGLEAAAVVAAFAPDAAPAAAREPGGFTPGGGRYGGGGAEGSF
jgi:MFS family permease